MHFHFFAQALGDAGLPWDGPELKDLNRQRCGILMGSAMGGMATFAAGEEALVTAGALRGLCRLPWKWLCLENTVVP
jgi:hypothetical protein